MVLILNAIRFSADYIKLRILLKIERAGLRLVGIDDVDSQFSESLPGNGVIRRAPETDRFTRFVGFCNQLLNHLLLLGREWLGASFPFCISAERFTDESHPLELFRRVFHVDKTVEGDEVRELSESRGIGTAACDHDSDGIRIDSGIEYLRMLSSLAISRSIVGWSGVFRSIISESICSEPRQARP